MAMTPRFIEVNGRKLFCIHFRNPDSAPRFRVLVAPPFAEELNKCRRLLALTAHRLSQHGCDLLIPDLFGTGDSMGDFGAARWADWCNDWLALDAWFAAHSGAPRPAYLCVRSGALILSETASRLEHFGRARVVLWQPVLNGERFVRSFLRLRLVSDRLAGGQESIQHLGHQLTEGQSIEIGGYELTAEMAAAVSAAQLTPAHLQACPEVRILEFNANHALSMQPGTRELIERLRDAHRDIVGTVIECEPFWSTRDILSPNAAVSATLLALT